MACKLRAAIGQAIYRLRKCTVEPVIGIIKAVVQSACVKPSSGCPIIPSVAADRRWIAADRRSGLICDWLGDVRRLDTCIGTACQRRCRCMPAHSGSSPGSQPLGQPPPHSCAEPLRCGGRSHPPDNPPWLGS